jgi:HPt (histidine-containing phosphotransfer) domain-containing protein
MILNTARYGTCEIAPPEDLMDYIPEFLSNRDVDLNAFREACAASDFEELQRLGHRVKGVCRPFGFDILGRIAADVEAAAKSQNRPACDELISEFETILNESKRNFPAEVQH